MRAEKAKKREESHAMTAAKMRLVVAGIGYTLPELAACMKVPYRTLQDYYYGARSIPASFASKLKDEAKKIIKIRNEVFAGIDAEVAKVPMIITPREDV